MRGRIPLIPLLIFAIALLTATFFLGDIGVYNDDYFCNQRDVVTGEPNDLIMNRPWHLWRPLTRVVLIPLVTLLWPHPWMLHVISAMLHAAIVALVYTLLRRFRISPPIAGPVALAFMLYPVHFEAVLWIDIICSLMAVVLVMVIWHGYLWWVESSHHRPPWIRFCSLLGFGALAYAAACFNEQPPGALAALAAAPLALGLAAGTTPVRRLVRTALPIVSITIGLGIYLIGFFRHVRLQLQASTDSEIQDNIPTRLGELAAKIPGELLLRDFGAGAFREGWRTIELHPVSAALAFGSLAALGMHWLFRSSTTSTSAAECPKPASAPALAALGTAWVFFAWVPVAASHSHTTPRLHYVPCIGLAIIVAAVLSAVVSAIARSHLRRPVAIIAQGVFALAVACALIMWIGIQTNYQRRWLADRAEIASLSRVFADSIEPDTLLLPVRLQARTASTGSRNFDNHFQSAWVWQFAAGWNVQQGMRNTRIHTAQTGWGVAHDGLWISDDAPQLRGVMRARIAHPRPPDLNKLFPARRDHQGRELPWDRVVFFDIETPGATRIVTRLRLHVPNQLPIEIVPRQVALSPLAAALPEHVLDLYPIPPDRRNPVGTNGERIKRPAASNGTTRDTAPAQRPR